MKITDFASAILAAGHGWLMFAEKTIYEDTLTIDKGQLSFKSQNSNSMSTLLRIVSIVITILLVFTIVKHY